MPDMLSPGVRGATSSATFALLASMWAAGLGGTAAGAASAFLDVHLAPNGGYSVVLEGKTWLRSGELRLFANNEWHSPSGGAPPPPPPPVCQAINHTDMQGGHLLFKVPNTTTASCCQHCRTNKSCDAWSWAAAADPPDDSATHHLFFADAHDCFLLGGVAATRPSAPKHPRTFGWARGAPPAEITPGKLSLQSTGVAKPGSDRFGNFTKTSLRWKATSSGGATLGVETAFRVYDGTSAGTVVFEQSIPTGAKRTNYKNVSFAEHSTISDTKVLPFFHFPSFNTTASDSIWGNCPDAAHCSAGYLTWQGTQISRGFLPLEAGPPTEQQLGLDSGPVVLFDATAPAEGSHALIVSPASHFKGAVQMRYQESWVAGVAGEVTEVPAGYTHETILHATAQGVSRTLDRWGGLMRKAHNTSKVPDVLTTHIGYWTVRARP
jgi:hypothetical protein